MGCGSSSLKGDAPDGVSNPAPKKVEKPAAATFSSVDYDAERDPTKQNSVAYDRAPHETDEHKRPSTGKSRDKHQDGREAKLEPYHTLEDPINSPTASYPHESLAGRPQEGLVS